MNIALFTVNLEAFPKINGFGENTVSGSPIASTRVIADPSPIDLNQAAPFEIQCPEDISTYTDLNECSADISDLYLQYSGGTLSRLTWEMTGATVDASPRSGINQINNYVFDEGITFITYTATDQQGNTLSCSFTVTISDNQVPRLLQSPGNISVDADPDECGARVYWNEPVAVDNCTPGDKMLISSTHVPGTVFPIGTTRVTYTINDGVETNQLVYSFLVTVTDRMAPELTAPDDLTINCGDPVPPVFAGYDEFNRAGGVAMDNCTVNFRTFQLESQKQDQANCPYTITRTYSITDEYGNKGTVEHHIHVVGEAPLITKEPTLPLKSGMGTITSTGTGGNWNDPATWVGGVVPGSGDDVVIASGAVVTVNTTAYSKALSIQSTGTLQFSGTNSLQVNGDFTNNGTFTAGSGTVEFAGGIDATIGGSSNTTFNNFTLNKGSDVFSTLTVQSNITIDSLTFSNGVLDVNTGTTTITHIANASNTIPSTSGLIVSGGTLNTGDYSIINEGLIQITSGTANFGNSSGNSVHTQIDGAFAVSGSSTVVNIAGRLENTAGGTLAGFYNSGINISNGTINLSTVGNGASGAASLMISEYGAFNFGAGTINFINPNSNLSNPLDLDIAIASGSGTKTITSGVFNFGDGT